jgi:hypothetical protein
VFVVPPALVFDWRAKGCDENHADGAEPVGQMLGKIATPGGGPTAASRAPDVAFDRRLGAAARLMATEIVLRHRHAVTGAGAQITPLRGEGTSAAMMVFLATNADVLRGDHAQTKRCDHDAIPSNRIMIQQHPSTGCGIGFSSRRHHAAAIRLGRVLIKSKLASAA